MAYWVAYLMKAYNIPIILIVNSDQTNVHFIPIARERTLENKRTQHIQVLGVENKRQVILVVSSVANGFFTSPSYCVHKYYT